MCGQHKVRASARDSTGQNTKDTHQILGQKLKFLTPPGIEPVGLEGRTSTDRATATDILHDTFTNTKDLFPQLISVRQTQMNKTNRFLPF